MNKKTENFIKSKKEFKKLGFTYLDTAEIIVALNHLLANYQIHYHKLRRFHWNVEGPDFFELHEAFEQDYTTTEKNIDEIAERIRVFGVKPMLSIKDTLDLSEIKEVKKSISSLDMVREVLKDFEILHDKMLNVLNASLETGDNVTEQMISEFMKTLEKRNWMYSSWCK
ncbi:DNA starvation/stationary phase protection protein [Yeosuana sp. MJ-SS3]|uniref:DNA starvation/stationary phase protection protein n=1 Tax=Gilvirhabdus luticola TaxID=3079858 RepID=A0ABU3U2I0_9FLAO|nr:DNA starvation/stationary phase protection protein [Yeosuana sp. MJ-SS3]MDU8884541.1 DNA starvation/stationary phase protection protein [Yeosuana sp. MJ-SS3]